MSIASARGSLLLLAFALPAAAQIFAGELVTVSLSSAITVFGILNLDATALVPLGTGSLDAFGEARVAVIFPASLPPGIAIALQGGVGDPSPPLGARLTNAETIVLR